MVEETLETTVVQESEPAVPALFDDDDIKEMPAAAATAPVPATALQTSALLNTTSSFITQLTNILSDAAATESLVQSLTRKDKSTGQTYLQIPVENEAIVKNAITLLAGLFKSVANV